MKTLTRLANGLWIISWLAASTALAQSPPPATNGPGYDTNLSLEFSAVSSRRVSGLIHGTASLTPYAIFSKQALTWPAWSPEAVFYGVANTNFSPFSLPALDRDRLFLQARSRLAPRTIGAGYLHNVAVRRDGTVGTWGANDYGQLGNGQWVGSLIPVQVMGLSNIVAVAVQDESYFTLALDSDGTVWSWGANGSGQLGRADGLYQDANLAAPVPGLSNVVAIAAGWAHSIALKSDGTIWAWGYNGLGELGDGSTMMRDYPAPVIGVTNAIAIASGSDFSFALCADGTVWGWGYNKDGELGIGNTENQLQPVRVPALTNVVALSVGLSHALALQSDGTVLVWGDDWYGQLGDGGYAGSLVPVAVPGLSNMVALAGGAYHSLAFDTDGRLFEWGDGEYDQLGNGVEDSRQMPFPLNAVSNVVAIAAGAGSSLVSTADGRIYQWGQYGCLDSYDWRLQVFPFMEDLYDAIDSDADGLPDWFETQLGMPTNDPDSDDDGINDYEAIHLGPPNPFYPLHFQLGAWRFDTTNWLGEAGQVPLTSSNLQSVLAWSGSAVRIGTNTAAVLAYRAVETNLSAIIPYHYFEFATQANYSANITLRQGTIRLWFKPDWSSVDTGGSGPGTNAVLFAIGLHSADFTTDFWGLEFDGRGERLRFSSEGGGDQHIGCEAPVSFSSNQWCQIVLAYDTNNCAVYTNGVLAATGTGIAEYPGRAARQASGFTIGSTAAGDGQAFGLVDNMDTFNYPLSAAEVEMSYYASQGTPTPHWPSPGAVFFVGTNNLVLNVEGVLSATLAVLVNDNDFTHAVAHTYYANPAIEVPINLGTTDGIYLVHLGIWTGTNYDWTTRKIVLDTTPPQIVPAGHSLTTNLPLLQLTGYATEALSAINFDVMNSQTTNLDQTGFIVASDGNTFAGAVSTNWLQCFDIRLAPGLNTITLRCADLAGSISTNIYSYTLDTSAMVAPTLSVDWPSDGAIVSGNKITLKGRVSDPTAAVVAQMAQNGSTNSVPGVVERDGTFWIDNVALPEATNAITITATDIASNSTSATIAVQTSPLKITVDPISDDALKGDSMTVSGMIDAGGYDILVNEISAAVWTNGDGGIHWQATNVPVPPGGVATFRIQAISDSDPEVLASFDRPTYVQASHYTETLNYHWISAKYLGFSLGIWWKDYYKEISLQRAWAWDGRTGGDGSSDFYFYHGEYSPNPGISIVGPCHTEWQWSPTPPVINRSCSEFQLNPWGDDDPEVYGLWQPEESPTNIPCGHLDCSFSLPSTQFNPARPDEYSAQYDYTVKAQTRLNLVVGGRALPGQPAMVTLKATAATASNPSGWDLDLWQNIDVGCIGPGIEPLPQGDDLSVPPGNIQIAGITCAGPDGINGFVTVVVPAGRTNLDVTPLVKTPSDCYSFDVTPVNFQMAVDNNRDGRIAFDGSDATEPAKPFRFWINDSSEGGDISSATDQIPGSGANYTRNLINGASDVVNFFPVALSLSNVLQWLPITNGFEYRLSQADGAVNFIYTDLEHSQAFGYLTNLYNPAYYKSGFGFNMPIDAASKYRVLPGGVALLSDFLNRIMTNGNKGVILLEGCSTSTAPLMLEFCRNGRKLGGAPLYLSIGGVEQMYRHLNLRDGADAPPDLPGPAYSGDAGLASSMGNPVNFPDNFLDDTWLIFVHGYNVNAQNSRGWESEMFKRFYWSHSRSKFVGVDWLGNPDGGGLIAHFLPDYYLAEMNAFATAPSLATKVNALTGSKTVVAHSLGCGLAVVALNDFGLLVNHVCLLDAALARECFDGDSDEALPDMAYSPWTLANDPSTPNYPRSLWASDWHKLFQGANDARQTLTWNNRFTNAIPVVYSFYSSTEDVLGSFTGPPTQAIINNLEHLNGMGTYAWATQEKSKGNIVNLFGVNIVGSDYGGWGFNLYDGYLANYPIWYEVADCNCMRRVKTPAEIGTVMQDLLDGSRSNPLFKTGWGYYNRNTPGQVIVTTDTQYFTGPSWILGLYQPNQGTIIAADPAKNAQLLCQAIPALSLPVGAKETTRFENRNYNMPTLFADEMHWPRTVPNGVPEWRHSDFDNVAYPFIYGVFNRIISISSQ